MEIQNTVDKLGEKLRKAGTAMSKGQKEENVADKITIKDALKKIKKSKQISKNRTEKS